MFYGSLRKLTLLFLLEIYLKILQEFFLRLLQECCFIQEFLGKCTGRPAGIPLAILTGKPIEILGGLLRAITEEILVAPFEEILAGICKDFLP